MHPHSKNPDKKKKKLKIMKILIKMTGGGGSILCLMLNAEFLIISRVSRPVSMVSAFSLRFFLWAGAPSNINSYANLRNMSGNIP